MQKNDYLRMEESCYGLEIEKLMFVYPLFPEFMEKESIARNSYFVLREIVRNCTAIGKLQEIDIDVLTQTLTVAIHGLAALSIYKASYPWADRNVLAHTLVEGLLRGFRGKLVFSY